MPREIICRHEGEIISLCTSRSGDEAQRRHTRECDVHQRCTREKCEACPDYAPDEMLHGKPLRHLLFHIFPMASESETWKRAVDQLKLRWPLFTGRKIIAVCTGPTLSPIVEVRAYLPPDAEIIEVANEKHRREVASWNPLWDALRPNLNPWDYVLYAHAKGVTRPLDPGNSCHWWASLLYSLNLDHWNLIEAKLKESPIVGSFKKVGRGFEGVNSQWHYSGTFFWMRAWDALRRLATTAPPELWWGVEAWPGMAYRDEEAGSVFLEGDVPNLNLYSPAFWDHTVRPRYGDWLRANPPSFPWIEQTPLAEASSQGVSPVRWWMFDDWCAPMAEPIPVASDPVWEVAYENDSERGKRTTRELNAIPEIADLFARMRSHRCAREWSNRLGYRVEDDPTLHGGGIHVTAPGGWLSTHLDYARHPKLPAKRRALNFIAFLNPEWKSEWGGALTLCDPLGNIVERFEPKPGRLVAFEVGDLSYHGVEKTTGPVERLTAACYLLAEAGPNDTRQRALFLPNRGEEK